MVTGEESAGWRGLGLRAVALRVAMIGGVALAATGSPLHAAAKTIQVDCSKKTLASALADGGDPLTIEFWGICAEDVVIARDDVTLRGVVPPALPPGGSQDPATIVGAPGVPPAERRPGVWIDGGHRVTLESFTIQDSDGRGIHLTRGAEAVIRSLVVDGNARGGVILLESSQARIKDSSFDDGGGDGIGVWENSSVTFAGAISASGNGRVGILASNGSSLTVESVGAQIAADDNAVAGFALQFGADAQLAAAQAVTVSAVGNVHLGVWLAHQSSWAGTVTVQGSLIGLEADASSVESVGLDASANEIGVLGSLDSLLLLDGPDVMTNVTGLVLDGATAAIDGAHIENNTDLDVWLDFGSLASFDGANTVGSIDCGEGVLTRGSVSCPAPLAAAQAARSPSARLGQSRVGAGRLAGARALPRLAPLTLER